MLSHSSQLYEPAKARLLTIEQVAYRLAVSPATVRRLVNTGALPRVTVGGSVRFEPADVIALIEAGKALREGRDRPSMTASAHSENSEDPAARPGPRKTSAGTGRHETQ